MAREPMGASLMPIIRDGNNRVDEYETVPPPATPSGPIERARVSEARMADFAAERATRAGTAPVTQRESYSEGQARRGKALGAAQALAASRARGAQRAGFVKGATKAETPSAPASASRYPLPRDRSERDARVIAALRAHPTVADAATELGVSETRVGQILKQIRLAGAMPADLNAAIKSRSATAAAKVTGRVPLAPAATEPEGREASVPATDAVDRGTTGGPSPRPPELLPPPGPTEPGVENAYSAPDPTRAPEVLLPCEGCVHVAVCAIKPGLEVWARLLSAQTPPLRPHPAIAVAAISIACAHELQEARP